MLPPAELSDTLHVSLNMFSSEEPYVSLPLIYVVTATVSLHIEDCAPTVSIVGTYFSRAFVCENTCVSRKTPTCESKFVHPRGRPHIQDSIDSKLKEKMDTLYQKLNR